MLNFQLLTRLKRIIISYKVNLIRRYKTVYKNYFNLWISRVRQIVLFDDHIVI